MSTHAETSRAGPAACHVQRGSRTAEWWTPSEDALSVCPALESRPGLPGSCCLPCRLPGGGQQSSTLRLQFLVMESYPKYLKNI